MSLGNGTDIISAASAKKFRIWDNVDKCWVDPKDYLLTLDGGVVYVEHNWLMDSAFFDVCQSTGRFLDGKELFEGDVLRVYEYYCEEEPELNEYTDVVIKYDSTGGCLVVEYNYWDYDLTAVGWALDYFDAAGYHVELIGNIFENPELLEGGA